MPPMFDAHMFVGADVLADELVSIWLYVACLLDYSALVWGSSAKHKPQRVGRVSFSCFSTDLHSISSVSFCYLVVYYYKVICSSITWRTLVCFDCCEPHNSMQMEVHG
jgi:hypothetical protein